MFLTFQEYVEMGGTLPEAEFTAYERKARACINLTTHNRVKNETPVRECVKEAAFDLIDALVRETAASGDAMAGVSRKSNDGVSVTYANGTSVRQYWNARKLELLMERLADETVTVGRVQVPLLYGGVEFDGGDGA